MMSLSEKPLWLSTRSNSPVEGWNSTPGSSWPHSMRLRLRWGRFRVVVTLPVSGMQSIATVLFRRKTSSPRGRNRRAVSPIHAARDQIDAVLGDREVEGGVRRGTSSALASTNSIPRRNSASQRRAVSNCAGVTSTPDERRCPALRNHAPK